MDDGNRIADAFLQISIAGRVLAVETRSSEAAGLGPTVAPPMVDQAPSSSSAPALPPRPPASFRFCAPPAIPPPEFSPPPPLPPRRARNELATPVCAPPQHCRPPLPRPPALPQSFCVPPASHRSLPPIPSTYRCLEPEPPAPREPRLTSQSQLLPGALPLRLDSDRRRVDGGLVYGSASNHDRRPTGGDQDHQRIPVAPNGTVSRGDSLAATSHAAVGTDRLQALGDGCVPLHVARLAPEAPSASFRPTSSRPVLSTSRQRADVIVSQPQPLLLPQQRTSPQSVLVVANDYIDDPTRLSRTGMSLTDTSNVVDRTASNLRMPQRTADSDTSVAAATGSRLQDSALLHKDRVIPALGAGRFFAINAHTFHAAGHVPTVASSAADAHNSAQCENEINSERESRHVQPSHVICAPISGATLASPCFADAVERQERAKWPTRERPDKCRCGSCDEGHECIECVTCVSCVRTAAEWRLRQTEGGVCEALAQDPCSCAEPACCARYAIMALATPLLPALCCYWPLRLAGQLMSSFGTSAPGGCCCKRSVQARPAHSSGTCLVRTQPEPKTDDAPRHLIASADAAGVVEAVVAAPKNLALADLSIACAMSTKRHDTVSKGRHHAVFHRP